MGPTVLVLVEGLEPPVYYASLQETCRRRWATLAKIGAGDENRTRSIRDLEGLVHTICSRA